MTNLTLHVMVLGLLICLVSYFRLPPPNPSIVRKVLGAIPEPGMSDSLVGEIESFRLKKEMLYKTAEYFSFF